MLDLASLMFEALPVEDFLTGKGTAAKASVKLLVMKEEEIRVKAKKEIEKNLSI